MNTASAFGDNVMEMISQDSNGKDSAAALETRPANKVDSSSVGWGQLPSQNSRPLTLLYAKKPGPKVDTKNIAWRALELTRDTAYAIGDLAERAAELAAEEPEEENAPGLLEKAKKRADTIKKLPATAKKTAKGMPSAAQGRIDTAKKRVDASKGRIDAAKDRIAV